MFVEDIVGVKQVGSYIHVEKMVCGGFASGANRYVCFFVPHLSFM